MAEQPQDVRAQRLRVLLGFEIDRLVTELSERRPMLVSVWSRARDREVFEEVTFHRWRTLGFHDLALLDSDVIRHLEAFYRELDRTRAYLASTHDMPATVEEKLETAVLRLAAVAQPALDALDVDTTLPSVDELVERVSDVAEEE